MMRPDWTLAEVLEVGEEKNIPPTPDPRERERGGLLTTQSGVIRNHYGFAIIGKGSPSL